MTVALPRCPICGDNAGVWRTVNGYRLDRCRRCRFVFVNPRPGREEMREFYRSVGGHCGSAPASLEQVLERERLFPNTTVDAARMYDRIDSLAPPARRALDVGCGYGLFAREAQRRGYAVDAIEIAPFERACARELTGIEPANVEFEDFPEAPESYAVVLMSQILEHAVDANEWVAKAHRLLQLRGVLCVAVPNFGGAMRRLFGSRDPYVNPPVHLNYFSAANLRLLLGQHGFDVRVVETVSRVPPDVLSKRIPRAPATLRRMTQRAAQLGQRPPLGLVDRLGAGIFLNVYAVRT